MQNTKLPWLQIAYQRFAHEGPTGLKVEVLAKAVGKSKSSFYHLFADVEVFTEALLAYHLERARLIAERERACQNVVPELLHVLVEFKEDLLFSRQLRVHRQVPAFKHCFEKVNQMVGDAFLDVWAASLDLSEQRHLAREVLALALENFYLQITPNNLNYDWLLQYFSQLRSTVRGLKNSGE
jgi:AcrR family transcriptional regulator